MKKTIKERFRKAVGKALGKVAEKAVELLSPLQPEPRRALAPARPRHGRIYIQY